MKKKDQKIKVKFVLSDKCYQILTCSVEARPELGHIASDLGARSFEILVH